MTPQILPIPLPIAFFNMAGYDSSIRGSHHGEQEPPVAQAELHQLQNSFVGGHGEDVQ